MLKPIVSLLLFVLLFNVSAEAANPRWMDPSMTDYIESLQLANPQHYNRFNLLLVGYDNPTVRRSSKLTSRSDVMMVISFDKASRTIDILSVGRDFRPNPGCHSRAGRSR
ncbi:MAG: hypothetical protein MJK18_14090, partial [Bdellovibrionales bacterium]|nr:hypothetical protein [Bdellovibrionales bacterium]